MIPHGDIGGAHLYKKWFGHMGRVNDHSSISPFFTLFEDEAPITLFFLNCDQGSFGSLDVFIGYTLSSHRLNCELIKAQYGAIDVAILC